MIIVCAPLPASPMYNTWQTLIPHVIGREVEAWQNEVTCPKSLSLSLWKAGIKSRRAQFKPLDCVILQEYCEALLFLVVNLVAGRKLIFLLLLLFVIRE